MMAHTTFIARLLLLPMLWCSGRANANITEQEPPAKLITSFRFDQLTGGVIIIRGTLDNFRDSLNFVLDTGSGGISLDSTTAERLNIELTASGRTIKGIAGVRTVKFANNHTLRLKGLKVDSLNFHINDYELLTGVYGIKVDGIIGYSFFRRYIVKIDYDLRQLFVFSPGRFKYPAYGQTLRPAIVGLPMQYAEVEENQEISSRFYLDTGAGLCLLLSDAFVKDSSLFGPRKRKYRTVAEGLGGKKEMEMAVLRHFKLGKYKFKKLPIFLFEDTYNVTSYPQLGGLIGNDLLRRFNVVINYQKSEFHITPNSHFRDQFDYSYTGLGLYSEDGKILVTDVIPGSPAAEAGMQVGDIILAVDNNLSNSMQIYRGILQESGKKVKFLVNRDGDLVQTTVKVEKIKP